MPLLFRSCLPAAFTSSFIHLPWLFWSFLNFEPLLGTIFCLKFFQTLLNIGGGADVCPPGVSCTEDVDREVQCWAYPYPLGRRMMVDTCCYYSGFVYLRFLSAVQGLQKHSWAFLLSRGKFFRFWFPIWAQFWFLWLNGHSTPLSSYTSPCGIQIFSSSSCAIWFGLL